MAVMAKRDLDKAASRFLTALSRIESGLVLQRQRILDLAASAPRLLPESQTPVLDLTGDVGNDLDYYIYELARLQDTGRSIIKVFGRPPGLIDAQSAFESGIPNLRTIRNSITHPNDNDSLDDVAWFTSAVKLKRDGRVEILVDPRGQHHVVATVYLTSLMEEMRKRVRNAINSHPPKTIAEQIAARSPKVGN